VEVILMWLLSRRMNLGIAAALWLVVITVFQVPMVLERIDRLIWSFSTVNPTVPFDEDVQKILPLKEIFIVGSFLPLGFTIHATRLACRRWYRLRHDLCLTCGQPIEDWHGHCPHCGVRVGPDPVNKVHVLRG
jgi:hypothetical protein